MKSLLVILFLMHSIALFAQKTHKKVDFNNQFPYTYKVKSKHAYSEFYPYEINVYESGTDSLGIYGYTTAPPHKGIITYSYDSITGSINTENGRFKLVIPKSHEGYLAEFKFFIDEYIDQRMYISLQADKSAGFFLEKRLIFSSGFSSLTIHSASKMGYGEINTLINCLPAERDVPNNCYDPEQIQITYKEKFILKCRFSK